MNGAAYIISAWLLVIVCVAVYSFALLRRGRALSARVPVHRRRWFRATTDPSE